MNAGDCFGSLEEACGNIENASEFEVQVSKIYP